MNTILRKIISTSTAPLPVAPYNQAVVADRTVYVSGCLGMDKDSGKLATGGAAIEAELALKNLSNVLLAAGSNIENVVKTTVYLQDLVDFQAVNDVYSKVFFKDCPARTCFQVAKLPLGALVEIEAIALVGDVKTVLVSDRQTTKL